MMMFDPSEDCTACRVAFDRGQCPCCQGSNEGVNGGLYGVEAKAIGEGVVMCAECVRRGHHEIPGVVEHILACLVKPRR